MMMRNALALARLTAAVLVAFAALSVGGAARAADSARASPKEAEFLVKKAVEYLQKNGKEKAYAAFNDPKGPFTYRDLYVTVYALDGTCVAHGQKKERIGKNLLGDKDPAGKAFVAERIQIAKEKGQGWQQYKFTNPETKQVEEKVAFFLKVDDVVVSCGAYKK